jgi:hypothetical protein
MAANDQAASLANGRIASHAPQGFRLPPAALHTKLQMLFDEILESPSQASRPSYKTTAVLLISWKDSDLIGVEDEVGYLHTPLVGPR